jgi:hypothetical protein
VNQALWNSVERLRSNVDVLEVRTIQSNFRLYSFDRQFLTGSSRSNSRNPKGSTDSGVNRSSPSCPHTALVDHILRRILGNVYAATAHMAQGFEIGTVAHKLLLRKHMADPTGLLLTQFQDAIPHQQRPLASVLLQASDDPEIREGLGRALIHLGLCAVAFPFYLPW